MAPNPTPTSKLNTIFSSSSPLSQLQHPNLKLTPTVIDDDDFQDYPSISLSIISKPLIRPSKKLKKQKPINSGKENVRPNELAPDLGCGLDSLEPTLDFFKPFTELGTRDNLPSNNSEKDIFYEDGSTQLNVLLKLCAEDELKDECVGLISCPLCGADISELNDELKQVHTNQCLDELDGSADVAIVDDDTGAGQCSGQVLDGSPLKSTEKVVDVSSVVTWLRNLGLSKYEEVFVKEEIDWDSLQWLTEEDLCNIGITALGPRKKIVHALKELRNDSTRIPELNKNISKIGTDEANKLGTNKLITDYFIGSVSVRKKSVITSNIPNSARRITADPTHKTKSNRGKGSLRNRKEKDVPVWCCIPGTPFRVDAFKYLRRDSSHWFLTHFHLDHYQGLTKSFSHGMICCSSITAKLINLKLGIPWENIQVLPLNQKISISGVNVTCFDANHCPGAIIILFEPPNGKPVLHTGDFRFSDEMTKLPCLQSSSIHTLILDTTYCNPQYDFPKQEAVIQFVIDAIQAEAFNPKTLFLIGSYTIGKERLFIELGKALRKKIFVTASKFRLLECLGLQQEDMQWLTLNEQESHIHVVPMWTIASFKRLKHMSNQYTDRFSLIVAFSPTGWTFGKGKKSTGRRWQQGTIIRYEVPYSEHSSFTELKAFVKFISPEEIIPSVNNDGLDSQNLLVSQLLA